MGFASTGREIIRVPPAMAMPDAQEADTRKNGRDLSRLVMSVIKVNTKIDHTGNAGWQSCSRDARGLGDIGSSRIPTAGPRLCQLVYRVSKLALSGTCPSLIAALFMEWDHPFAGICRRVGVILASPRRGMMRTERRREFG